MQIDAADGALGENPGAVIARGLGDRGRGMGGFGASVGRGMQPGDETGAGARHHGIERLAAQQPGFHLIQTCLIQPRFLSRDFFFILAQI